MNKIYIVLFSLLALLILSACGPSDSAPEGVTGSQPSSSDPILAIPSDPIHVTPTLDTTRLVEEVIPASGGTLSASGADGTLFQLDIPASALVEDTLIRMTPVSQLDGMPFGSNPYAVQLEPEGLQFYAPVTLTITPAQQIPIDQQLFFTYQALGENLTLALPVVGSPEIKLELQHFSGYGVTKGLLADIEPVRERIGGTAEARLQSAVAEELSRERQRQLLGGDPAEMSIDFEDYFQQYEEQVIRPRIAAAGESCAAGRLAIQTVLGYERQRQLLGVEGEINLFDSGLMDTVANVCLKEEFELCRDQHIIHRIIPAWLGLERQYQLLGMVGEGAAVPVLEQARDYVRRCLTFELQFESQADFDDGGDRYTSSVQSTLKIQLDPVALTNATQAPLINTAYEFVVEGCSVNSQRGGGTFAVTSLVYIADTHSPSDELGYVRDFKLLYFPGNTTESTTITCEDSPPFTMPPSPMWTGIFLVLHEAELSMTEGGFLAEDWEIFGDEYFAKKEWIRDDAGLGITEAGTFKLYHRPESVQ